MITLFKDPFFTGLDTNRFLSTPETNITKSETEYSVSISVPGLTKEDLKISTKEGILKIIYEKHGAVNSIPVSSWPAGVYYIDILIGGKHSVQKAVVNHF